MRRTTVIAILLLTAFTLSVDSSMVPSQSDGDFTWTAFKLIHRKEYEDSIEEDRRYAIFRQRLQQIHNHNRRYSIGLETYRTEINQFTDMTPEEFQKDYLSTFKREREPVYVQQSQENHKLPKSMDWRKHGIVTPVKDQGQCGSCWAFSTTGAIESHTARFDKYLVSLSEQQLVDCSSPEGNHGCDGGIMDFAFKYIIESGGIESERDYEYTGVENGCAFNRTKVAATVIGYGDIKPGSEKGLKMAVAEWGPVSVAIDASGWGFMHYSDGVYTSNSCNDQQLNHGVLVVGYGSQRTFIFLQTDYWIVKNSWGPTWGDNGYIKMARNRGNMCGIASMASFPLVPNSHPSDEE